MKRKVFLLMIGMLLINFNAFAADGDFTVEGSFNVDNGKFFYNSTTNRIGMGTLTPASYFHIEDLNTTMMRTMMSANGISQILMESYGDLTWMYPSFVGKKSRGSKGAHTPVMNGDVLFRVGAGGYDINGETMPKTYINFIANEDWQTGPGHGTRIGVFTTTNGVEDPTEKLTISHNGNIGIGKTDPKSALQVNGYIQLALTSGTPPSGDCDETAEYGRMKVDSADGRLYICVSSGWVYK
ncbi:MAG: hypothetical protein Q7U10_09495 [Thermodesulfovibrionia bacterium]|nr:hypothetical protein [Thermodesulfovibrionia bacterium]